jgi:outer membrane protein assembly factor BamE
MPSRTFTIAALACVSRIMPSRTFTIAALACVSLLLTGCNLSKLRLPRVHKLTVQQGNVITQDMIDQLKPGMSRSQVAYIMGEPVFRNSFNEDRWDYIYTIELPGVFADERRVSVYFDNDRLAYFTGDYAPTESKPPVEEEVAAVEEGPSADASD